MFDVAVECIDIKRNSKGEGNNLDITDADVARKLREQTRLDTSVVSALNDVH